MVIVSGRITVRRGTRETFLDMSREAMEMARRFSGCRDFTIAADPIEPDRVNVYEEWDSKEALLAFRGEGPSAAMNSIVISTDVRRHRVSITSPA
jgi:quinol monooxygenase YgiN